MTYIGWTILLICLLTGGTLFFSVNAVALRIFSRVKLLDAFKAVQKDGFAERIIQNTEKLTWACSAYRLIFNMCILLLIVEVFTIARPDNSKISNYLFAGIIAIPIVLVFSLAIPHAWAKYAGEKILSRTHKIVMLFAVIAWPAIYIHQLYDGLVRRLAGVAKTTPHQKQEEKQEEFLNGLEQRKIEGVVDAEEQEMIENVLELSETTVDEIMTPRTEMIAIEISSNRKTVLDTIITAGHSRVPVYEGNIDNIIGLIYAKDLLAEIDKTNADFRLRDKLREVYFVPETKPLRVLLHEFQNQKLHIAVVLDEYGGTAGIVTLEDIIEELVGEITDEYEEHESEQVKEIDHNTIELDARTYIDQVNDLFDLNLSEEEDYETIGGFVFSHLGYIPKAGDSFIYENLKFSIRSAEPRRIKRIRIQKLEDS